MSPAYISGRSSDVAPSPSTCQCGGGGVGVISTNDRGFVYVV